MLTQSQIENVNQLLDEISPREQNFLVNFLISKTEDTEADSLNFAYDLHLYQYNNSGALISLFLSCYHNTDYLFKLIKQRNGEK